MEGELKMRAKGGRKPKHPAVVTLARLGTAGKSPLPLVPIPRAGRAPPRRPAAPAKGKGM
jgi:hypothetical protein